MQPLSDYLSFEEFEAVRTNGIKIYYWAVCKRRLWLYSKGLRMERLSDIVALGRLLHEKAYPDLPRKEILIDDLIKIDLIEAESKLLEIKHSKKLIDAARLQVAYYLLYLRYLGAKDILGELRFPREKRREEVRLSPDLELKVKEALEGVRETEGSSEPPEAHYSSLCRVCSYVELCWG